MFNLNELNDIFINFISDFVFWIFLIIVGSIGWLFNKTFSSKFKKVKIKRIDVRNVPKRFNGIESAIFQNQGALKNYIENELVIENSKDDLIIHNLVVDKVEVKNYFYEDIVIQNGFDMPTQNVDFVIFNNGNRVSSLNYYLVKYHYLNKINNKDKVIFESELNIDNLNGGDIKRLFSKTLTDHNIIKFFSNKISDYKQSIRIELINQNNQETESEIEIPYLSSEKIFVRNLGGGGLVDRTLTPIIELVFPYNQNCFNFSINHHLKNGENTLRFNILIDSPCCIKYDVKLFRDNKMLTSFSSNLIEIQFPKYRLLSPYKDELYHYLHDEKLESSDFEEVKLRKPELINNINKIKTEYHLN
mgnify:CR=1 FL=1